MTSLCFRRSVEAPAFMRGKCRSVTTGPLALEINDQGPWLKPIRHENRTPLMNEGASTESALSLECPKIPFDWPILPLNRKILGDLGPVVILKWI